MRCGLCYRKLFHMQPDPDPLDAPPLIPERSSLQLLLRVLFEISEAIYTHCEQGTLWDDTVVLVSSLESGKARSCTRGDSITRGVE